MKNNVGMASIAKKVKLWFIRMTLSLCLSLALCIVQGGSYMTGTNCDLFTHNQSRLYLNHLV